MVGTLKLLLPVLIPSWRFFDGVAPSPRIEYALLGAVDETAKGWQEFRPRPEHVSLALMLRRMIWNPSWNETLFLVSCSERLVEHPAAHSVEEIFTRLSRELMPSPDKAHLQFRLVFVSREGEEIIRNVAFISDVRLMEAAA